MDQIELILSWLLENWEKILPVVVAVIGWWVNAGISGKVKLIYGRANVSFHTVKASESDVARIYCEKFYVQNLGSKAATNIEVSFSGAPTELSTYPPLEYEIATSPSGKMILKIPSISPKELVVIDTIHVNKETANILTVRSNEMVGKQVPFIVQRRFGGVLNTLVVVVMVLGIYYGLFLLISFGSFLFGLAK